MANAKNRFAEGNADERYIKAIGSLKKLEREQDLTVGYFRTILEATHIEGAVGNTEYSYVIDLTRGVIHLNHWHQYAEAATIYVAKEIASHVAASRSTDSTVTTPNPVRIKTLFSAEIVREAEREHQEYKQK